jgi:hypothetical protein
VKRWIIEKLVRFTLIGTTGDRMEKVRFTLIGTTDDMRENWWIRVKLTPSEFSSPVYIYNDQNTKQKERNTKEMSNTPTKATNNSTTSITPTSTELELCDVLSQHTPIILPSEELKENMLHLFSMIHRLLGEELANSSISTLLKFYDTLIYNYDNDYTQDYRSLCDKYLEKFIESNFTKSKVQELEKVITQLIKTNAKLKIQDMCLGIKLDIDGHNRLIFRVQLEDRSDTNYLSDTDELIEKATTILIKKLYNQVPSYNIESIKKLTKTAGLITVPSLRVFPQGKLFLSTFRSQCNNFDTKSYSEYISYMSNHNLSDLIYQSVLVITNTKPLDGMKPDTQTKLSNIIKCEFAEVRSLLQEKVEIPINTNVDLEYSREMNSMALSPVNKDIINCIGDLIGMKVMIMDIYTNSELQNFLTQYTYQKSQSGLDLELEDKIFSKIQSYVYDYINSIQRHILTSHTHKPQYKKVLKDDRKIQDRIKYFSELIEFIDYIENTPLTYIEIMEIGGSLEDTVKILNYTKTISEMQRILGINTEFRET